MNDQKRHVLAPGADPDFVRFLRTVGRGPTLSRPLDRDEARSAFAAILGGTVASIQLGAFLLVLRHRGETAEELAGFVEAARATFAEVGASEPVADLDWPSYADRHRQQPWFALAARLLADAGVRVLIHGIAGEAAGYAPTRPVLRRLGIPFCDSPRDAARALRVGRIAYLGLESFCPAVDRLFALRPMLGVRTVANSLARALNPLAASCQMQGVFHPPYRVTHRDAAVLLGQPTAAVFKGGGGEAQRNPLKPCRVDWVVGGRAVGEEDWPARLPDLDYAWREEPLTPELPAALWRGEVALPAPEAMVVGTVALALKALGRAISMAEAEAMADDLWRRRARQGIAAAT